MWVSNDSSAYDGVGDGFQTEVRSAEKGQKSAGGHAKDEGISQKKSKFQPAECTEVAKSASSDPSHPAAKCTRTIEQASGRT